MYVPTFATVKTLVVVGFNLWGSAVHRAVVECIEIWGLYVFVLSTMHRV